MKFLFNSSIIPFSSSPSSPSSSCIGFIYLALYSIIVFVSIGGDWLLRTASSSTSSSSSVITTPITATSTAISVTINTANTGNENTVKSGNRAIMDYVASHYRRYNIRRYAIALSDTAIHGTIGLVSWLMFAAIKSNRFDVSGFDLPAPGGQPQSRKAFLHRFLHPIVRDSILCGTLAAVIDLDHVIAARSFAIQNLVSLRRRPPLHNTTLLMTISLLAIFFNDTICSNYFKNRHRNLTTPISSIFTRFGYLLLIASVSHHVRDALRHGFNLWPIGTIIAAIIAPHRNNNNRNNICRTIDKTAPVPLYAYFVTLFVLPAICALISTNDFGYFDFGTRYLGVDFAHSLRKQNNRINQYDYVLLTPGADDDDDSQAELQAESVV